MNNLNLRDIVYRLKKKVDLQFVKLSWIDMKRDKAKTIFGILGIAISICLMTSIGMVNDTINYNYIQLVTNTTGSADVMISRTIKTDLTFDPFFDENILNHELSNITGIEELFPRIMNLVVTSSDKTNLSGSLELYGIDFKAEAENGKIGDLRLVSTNGTQTGKIYTEEPKDGECVILWNVVKLLNVTKGDIIHLKYQQYTLNVTVVEVCEQYLKFMEFEKALIIVNLNQAQKFLNREGKINFIYGTIKNPELIYDSSNVDETTRRLRIISADIQDRLDINEYTVSLPKLEQLQGGDFTLMGSTILYWFVTILSILITGILINSILSTSVEERIREFGILRVVGGKKKFPIKMVLLEGALLGFFGTLLGIIVSLFITPPIASYFFAMFKLNFSDIVFVVKFPTILMSLLIGTLISLLIALMPALRTARIDLIKSITPFHAKEEGWEVKKEGSMNVKSFLAGISVATIGMIIFVLLPNIFVTGEIMLIAGLFIGLLSAILIGLVFASIGIIPLIQRIFLGIISPTIRKYSNIINISLKRNRRRNTSTVVMFAISFSFIFFITAYSQMSSENLSLEIKFQYGADLVVINQGTDPNKDAVNLEMIDTLRTEVTGIDKVATTLYNSFDITAILSTFFQASEGGVGFGEGTTSQNQITGYIQFFSSQSELKYQTKIADISKHEELSAGLIGIDGDFLNLVNKDLIIWSSPGSGFNYSFTELFKGNNTCIIATSIATTLGIDDVGEKVRLTFYNPKIANDPGNITIFTVVGISGGIPGFFNFRSNQFAASGGGVMISQENYVRLMDVQNPGQNNQIVDKIFINLRDNSEKNIEDTKNDIRTTFNDKRFIIDDAISKVKFVSEMNQRRSALLEFILMFTVIICIFGLVSSMYAVFLERKFEIGILRSMGMRVKNVRNMFLVESLIIMLSSGIMGTIIGSYSAYLMQTNLSILTEMPVIFSINIDVLFRVFILSISIGVLFMYIILIKLSKQTIMDIFRQTF